MTAAEVDVLHQPISDLQLAQLRVEWVPHETIKPNKYNPNKMTQHDRALLRQSLLEDGWTQPIVTLPDATIVDGEQRWTTAGLPIHSSDVGAIIEKMERRKAEGYAESESILSRLRESQRRLQEIEAAGKRGSIAAITGGLVPITRVDFGDDAHKMISTIRHNRARGTHALDRMSAIVGDLSQLGLDFDDLENRLGMEHEEAKRLLEQVNVDDLIGAKTEAYSPAWEPVHLTTLSEDQVAAKHFERSRGAAEQAKQAAVAEVERQRQIAEQTRQAIAAEEQKVDHPLNQLEKERIIKQVESATPVVPKIAPPELKAFRFYVSPDEYELCWRVLGDPPVAGFMREMLARYREQFGEDELYQQAAAASGNVEKVEAAS